MSSYRITEATIFVVVLIAVHFNSYCDAASGVQVEYKSGQCTCKGLELRSPGSGPRTLKVNCSNKPSTINCQYKGNPHGCSAYNNNGQQKFYQQALNDIRSRICSLPSNNMICPKGSVITKICGDLGGKNLKYESGP